MTINPFFDVRLQFLFHYSAVTRSESVDSWARYVFEATTEELKAAIPRELTSDPCVAYLSRVLWFGRIILRNWRVPALEPGSILRILPSMKKENLKCEFIERAVEGIPFKIYENAYALSGELCLWCCKNRPADGSIAEFNSRLEQSVERNRPSVDIGAGSTIPVLQTAHRLGIPFFHIGRGVYQLGIGSRSRYLDRSHGEGDSFVGAILSSDKAATARILRACALPVPPHSLVTSAEDALSSAKSLGFPVVVKPVDANRGEGVTVNISTENELATAYDFARKHSKNSAALVEKQVAGVCHRLFIIRGQLLYAVKRLPLFVTGDGISTLEQLVERETRADLKRPFWLRTKMHKIDRSAFTEMAARGVERSSVPRRDERIFVRPIESTAWGGIDEDTTHSVHPINVAAAAAAAAALKLEVAGIDMISTDISIPWMENGAAINEVNCGPLLGGGEISRSHIHLFLEIYLGGRGLIDIERAAASIDELRDRQNQLLSSGIRSWIVFDDAAVDHLGRKVVFAPEHHQQPSHSTILRQVVLNRYVDHLIVAQFRSDAFLSSQIPRSTPSETLPIP